MITAVYARHREPDHLIEDLRENLAWVDRIVEVDGGDWGTPQGHEGRINRRKREAAGPGWTLFIDPDERLSDGAEDVIRGFVESASRDAIGVLPFREMWTPTQYRTDGWYGSRGPRKRIAHLHAGQLYASKPIHCQPIPQVDRANRVLLEGAILYHLKGIEPQNRVARARAYRAADPRGVWLRGGDWSYLHDDTGLELADAIPPFTPPYRHYLFAPAVSRA
jgi:hypothetical protein